MACRKDKATQDWWLAGSCEKWLKDQGVLVRCGKEGMCYPSRWPINIDVLVNGHLRGQPFGTQSCTATQADWHEAVIWAAEKLGIPVPWAPCECAECEGQWSEPIGEMDEERYKEVAEQIGGYVGYRFVDVTREQKRRYYFGVWWTNGLGSHTHFIEGHKPGSSEVVHSALIRLAIELKRYGSDKRHRIYLGTLPMPATPPRTEHEETECEHLRVVAENGGWVCDECGQEFLVCDHMRMHVTGGGLAVCSACDKVMVSSP